MTFVGITIGVEEIGVSVRVVRRTWMVGVDEVSDVSAWGRVSAICNEESRLEVFTGFFFLGDLQEQNFCGSKVLDRPRSGEKKLGVKFSFATHIKSPPTRPRTSLSFIDSSSFRFIFS